MYVNPNRRYIIVGRDNEGKRSWTLSYHTFNRDEAYEYCEELNRNTSNGTKYIVNSTVETKRESDVKKDNM